MSAGNVGGGFGESSSDELGRNVNRSTSENTFVILRGPEVEPFTVEELELDDISGATAGAFSFSFPRPVALLKARMKEFGSLAEEVAWVVVAFTYAARMLGPPYLTSDGDWFALAGWKHNRGL